MLLDPVNMDIAVGISFLSCMQAEARKLFLIDFWLATVIFDVQVVQTSGSIRTNLTVLPDTDKMEVAVVISLLYCVYQLRIVLCCSVLAAKS